MRKQFRETVTQVADGDEDMVLVFGDISAFLFKDFAARHPARFHNLGILENTIISVGAGLASQGLRPVLHTIAPFLTERSYEQIKLDLCYNKFPSTIVTCGASFDYAWDGATHHCYTDLAILRLLPGMHVIQPGSKKEFDLLFRSQYRSENPTYLRITEHPHSVDLDVKFGKGHAIKDAGAPVTVMTAGPMLTQVLEACQDLPVNLAYFHTLKPIDHELIARYRHTRILVVHDAFGLQEAIHEVPGLKTEYHGLPDEFCAWYGTIQDIRKKIGLDTEGIRARVKKFIAEG